jgi:hypothetical protein
MYLIAVALDAPVIGISQRWPNTIHAISMGEVVSGWERGTFVSACGRRSLRLWPHEVDGTLIAAPFPPRIKGLPDRLARCRDCWLLTGKKAPRTQWVSKEPAA